MNLNDTASSVPTINYYGEAIVDDNEKANMFNEIFLANSYLDETNANLPVRLLPDQRISISLLRSVM